MKYDKRLAVAWEHKSVDREAFRVIAAKPAIIRDPATIRTPPLLTNWPPNPRPLFELRPLFEPGLYTDKYGIYIPPPHSASCNLRMQYMRQCFYEQGHQCKLLRVITPRASRVFALVEGRKKPPAQVAEGQGDRAPASIGMQWGTTMNASTVLKR